MERGPARAMWACPGCGRTFANRNQSHACAPPGDLDRHFANTAPEVRAAFDAVLTAVHELGPVQVLAEKTRIALHASPTSTPSSAPGSPRHTPSACSSTCMAGRNGRFVQDRLPAIW